MQRRVGEQAALVEQRAKAPPQVPPPLQLPKTQWLLVVQAEPGPPQTVAPLRLEQVRGLAHWEPAVQVAPVPPQIPPAQLPFRHAPLGLQLAAGPPQIPVPQKATGEVAHWPLPLQGAPSVEALAAGAMTVCITGTDQATPPTMPAFFKKSRRDDSGTSDTAAAPGGTA